MFFHKQNWDTLYINDLKLDKEIPALILRYGSSIKKNKKTLTPLIYLESMVTRIKCLIETECGIINI